MKFSQSESVGGGVVSGHTDTRTTPKNISRASAQLKRGGSYDPVGEGDGGAEEEDAGERPDRRPEERQRHLDEVPADLEHQKRASRAHAPEKHH